MKKLLALTLICTSLLSVPKKSEAFVVTITAAGVSTMIDSYSSTSLGILTIGGYASALTLAVGGVTAIFNPALGGKIALYAVALDEKTNSPLFEQNIKNNFPFLNNQEIIKELSDELRLSFEKNRNDLGTAIVSIPKNTVERILAPVDLTNDQVAEIVETYK